MQSAQESGNTLCLFHKADSFFPPDRENGLILRGKCGNIDIVKKLTASVGCKFDLKENEKWQRKLY